MQSSVNGLFQNPIVRALILILLVIPVSVYLGTSPVRRGFLYYTGIFAPSVVAARVAASRRAQVEEAKRPSTGDQLGAKARELLIGDGA
jgi:hypothetical protein